MLGIRVRLLKKAQKALVDDFPYESPEPEHHHPKRKLGHSRRVFQCFLQQDGQSGYYLRRLKYSHVHNGRELIRNIKRRSNVKDPRIHVKADVELSSQAHTSG